MFSLKASSPLRWVLAVGLSSALFAVVPLPASPQAATSSSAPTASRDPIEIDQICQRASAKYDEQRAAILKEVDRKDYDGPFRPDWESLENYQVPEWYKDAKFGIFIHWGVYSVPAFGNEWYPRNMYTDTETKSWISPKPIYSDNSPQIASRPERRTPNGPQNHRVGWTKHRSATRASYSQRFT